MNTKWFTKVIFIFLITLNSFAKDKASLPDQSAPPITAGNESLYQLTSTWTDQNGQEKNLKAFSGQPVIITMGYTGCAHACPLIISKIKSIAKELKIKSYQVVFLSFDTIKDRPTDLKKYLEKKELDPKVWNLMSTNKEDTVREMANILGINYKDVGDGDFVHSNVITALDKNGNILAKVDNLNADISELVKKMNEADNGR